MATQPNTDTREQSVENSIELDLEQQRKRQKEQQQQNQAQTEAGANPDQPRTKQPKTESEQSRSEQQSEREEEKPILGLNYEKPPKHLSSRYNCTSLGEYLDKDGNFVFKDKGTTISTSRSNVNSVSDMLDVAEGKGWTDIKLKGTKEFRRATWLEAQSRGLGTEGYTPDERDLATLRDRLEHRQGNTIEPASKELNPTPDPTQAAQPEPEPEPEPEVGNQLVDHGEAPYLFKNDNAASYYATLEKSDGTQVTMWGVGIKEALEEHDIGQGDKIDLQKGGKVATTIQEPLHDEVGNVTGYQEKQVYRNEWTVDVLERAIEQPDITQPLIEAQAGEPQLEVAQKIEVEPKPVMPTRAQQMMEEAKRFQDEQRDKAAEQQKTPNDDLGLREGEANKLQAQHEMPTLAQINTSPKADIDSDVPFSDIGSQSIPSELSNEVQNWVNAPTAKQGRLNSRDKRVVSMMKSSAQETIGQLEPAARKQALRNYNENVDAAISGNTLNVPEHVKKHLHQQYQQQAQHTQPQPKPPQQTMQHDLEL